MTKLPPYPRIIDFARANLGCTALAMLILAYVSTADIAEHKAIVNVSLACRLNLGYNVYHGNSDTSYKFATCYDRT